MVRQLCACDAALSLAGGIERRLALLLGRWLILLTEWSSAEDSLLRGLIYAELVFDSPYATVRDILVAGSRSSVNDPLG